MQDRDRQITGYNKSSLSATKFDNYAELGDLLIQIDVYSFKQS